MWCVRVCSLAHSVLLNCLRLEYFNNLRFGRSEEYLSFDCVFNALEVFSDFPDARELGADESKQSPENDWKSSRPRSQANQNRTNGWIIYTGLTLLALIENTYVGALKLNEKLIKLIGKNLFRNAACPFIKS